MIDALVQKIGFTSITRKPSGAMRFISILLVQAIVGSAFAQPTSLRFIVNTLPQESHQRSIWFDMSTIQRDGEFVLVRVVAQYTSPPRGDETTKSVVNLMAYNCNSLYVVSRGATGTSGDFGEGPVTWSFLEPEWRTKEILRSRTLLPGSLGRIELDVACTEARAK